MGKMRLHLSALRDACGPMPIYKGTWLPWAMRGAYGEECQSILTLFKRHDLSLRVHPPGKLFMARAEVSSQYSTEHHSLIRTPRSHTLEPSRGLYRPHTCPYLCNKSRERTASSSTSSHARPWIVRPNHRAPKFTNMYHLPQHRPKTTHKIQCETWSLFHPFFIQQCVHHFIHDSCFSLPSPSTRQPPSTLHQNSARFQEILRSSSLLPPPTPSMI